MYQQLLHSDGTNDRSITITINLNNNRFNHKYCHVFHCKQLLCGEILTAILNCLDFHIIWVMVIIGWSMRKFHNDKICDKYCHKTITTNTISGRPWLRYLNKHYFHIYMCVDEHIFFIKNCLIIIRLWWTLKCFSIHSQGSDLNNPQENTLMINYACMHIFKCCFVDI